MKNFIEGKFARTAAAGTLALAEMFAGPVITSPAIATTPEAARTCTPKPLTFPANETAVTNLRIKRGYISGDVYIQRFGVEQQKFDSGTPDSANTGSVVIFDLKYAQTVGVRSPFGASGVGYPDNCTRVQFETAAYEAQLAMFKAHGSDPNFRPDPWFIK
jgi:hypothetical protein